MRRRSSRSTSWDENPALDGNGGSKVTHASVKMAFAGDLEGEGTVEWLMGYGDDGTAAFVGLERVVGKVGDRSGSFVLQHTGTFDGEDREGRAQRRARLRHRRARRHRRRRAASRPAWAPTASAASSSTTTCLARRPPGRPLVGAVSTGVDPASLAAPVRAASSDALRREGSALPFSVQRRTSLRTASPWAHSPSSGCPSSSA